MVVGRHQPIGADKIRDTADDTCVAYVHRLYFTRIAAHTMSYTSDTRITRACMHARVHAWLVRLKSNNNAFHRRRRIRDAVIQAAVDGDGDALMMMVTADPCKHMCGSRDDWTVLVRSSSDEVSRVLNLRTHLDRHYATGAPPNTKLILIPTQKGTVWCFARFAWTGGPERMSLLEFGSAPRRWGVAGYDVRV